MTSFLRRKTILALVAISVVIYFSFRGGGASSSPPPYVSPLRFPTPSSLPYTNIPVKAAGYHLFENLYVKEGIMYLVVEDPDHPNIPALRQMTSSGLPDSVGVKPREPSRDHMRIITKKEAEGILGGPLMVMDGFSIILNDPGPMFLTHLYHYWVELLLGAWKSYSHLDPTITPAGVTKLPPPARIIFPHAFEDQWRDKTGLNAWLTKMAFPGMAAQFKSDWDDWSVSGMTLMLERAVLVDRSAGNRGTACIGPRKRMMKMNSDILDIAPASPNWYQPVRQAVLRAISAPAPPSVLERPIIVYITRQGSGRSLADQDHTALVEALDNFRDRAEVHVAQMQTKTKEEQITLMSRTTILIGVHGNGLSHLVWMDPTPKSTVIEIFPSGLDGPSSQGFNYDYALPAMSLGIKHYSVSDNVALCEPNYPKVNFPPNFHRRNITVDAATITNLINERLGFTHPGL
ncbi:hypothetical protein BDY24DRAFT_383603 [Mrakia frigida]|uniref:uncharacterized protein n=1 Tax=Mrakia frigida TaxID=29902 RepID=UPI003FCC06F0